MTSCSLNPREEPPEEGVIVIGPFRFREVASVSFPQGLRRRVTPPPEEKPTEASNSSPAEKTDGGGACSIKLVRSFRVCAQTISLDEARTELPFPIALPTWVPPGFVLQEEVRAVLPNAPLEDEEGNPVAMRASSMASCSLTWRADAMRSLHLAIRVASVPGTIIRGGVVEVPPGGVQAVQVQGLPAALKTAQFAFTPYTGEVDICTQPTLQWEVAGIDYELRTHGDSVSIEDLLRIAESIPLPHDAAPAAP